jgi:hypothetical protein
MVLGAPALFLAGCGMISERIIVIGMRQIEGRGRDEDDGDSQEDQFDHLHLHP